MTLFFILTALKLPKTWTMIVTNLLTFSYFPGLSFFPSVFISLFIYIMFLSFYFCLLSLLFFFFSLLFSFSSHIVFCTYFVICSVHFLLFFCSCPVAADILNSAKNRLLWCVWELFVSHIQVVTNSRPDFLKHMEQMVLIQMVQLGWESLSCVRIWLMPWWRVQEYQHVIQVTISCSCFFILGSMQPFVERCLEAVKYWHSLLWSACSDVVVSYFCMCSLVFSYVNGKSNTCLLIRPEYLLLCLMSTTVWEHSEILHYRLLCGFFGGIVYGFWTFMKLGMSIVLLEAEY